MQMSAVGGNDRFVLQRQDFPELFAALTAHGYTIVGPTICEGAIVFSELRSVQDLPIGWTDFQDRGTYRLVRRDDEALFGYAVGPHSWKKFLHPPALLLWQARRRGDGFEIITSGSNTAQTNNQTRGSTATTDTLRHGDAMSECDVGSKGDTLHQSGGPPQNAMSAQDHASARENQTQPLAFLGVRSCDLHAIALLDRVFLGGPYVDGFYQERREEIFLIAVQCGQAGGNCFCVSMSTGPKATSGFDLALTEVLDSGCHYFVVEVGSQRGNQIVSCLPVRKATEAECLRAEEIVSGTATQMGRALDTRQLKELLYQNYEHPRWDQVAARCLACANCTMVCPTCFCTTVEDVTDLQGEHAERWRKWDSCFLAEFSYIHGGSVRASVRSRYRQWLTHKLATWHDQFGSSGCVGCGRCITWCPVGIDLTEEVAAIRQRDSVLPSAAPDGCRGT